jgi:hypothetical protein
VGWILLSAALELDFLWDLALLGVVPQNANEFGYVKPEIKCPPHPTVSRIEHLVAGQRCIL